MFDVTVDLSSKRQTVITTLILFKTVSNYNL